MNIGRLDPFAELTAVRERLNHLVEEQHGRDGQGRGAPSRVWQPNADILEDADAVTVVLDLPGVTRESIDIELSGESLSVRGERPEARKEGAHLVFCQRPFGAFQRSFTIGIPLQQDRVHASCRDGVLAITLPKAEELKPRKVEIQVGDGGG